MSLVTIILPAYNAEKTIARAIQSARCQEYSDLEIIVIDDGSSDSTLNICNALADKDNRLKIWHINNSGPSAARNYGLSQAKGEFICFMDADDEMSPTMISQLVSNMQDDTDLVACGYKVRSNNGDYAFEQKLDDKSYPNNRLYEFIENLQEAKAFNPLWNKIFRRSIINDNNIKMDTTVDMGEDYLFVVDYCAHTTLSLKTIDKILYCYHLSPNGLQVTANRDENYIRRISQLNRLRKLFEYKNYPLDSLNSEYMRVTYTSLIEDIETNNIITYIQQTKYLKTILSPSRQKSFKYKVFAFALSTNNSFVIKTLTGVFLAAKRKKFKW